MAGIQLRLTVDIAAAVKEVTGMGGRTEDLTPAYHNIGNVIAADARDVLNNRPSDWGPVSGLLAQSVNAVAGPDHVEVGSNLKYAAIQMTGGVVLPKKKYLAIPATRKAARAKTWPRDYPPGMLSFVRVARITVGSHSWVGPALVLTKSLEKAKATARKKGRGKASRKRADAIITKGVVFGLIKKATIVISEDERYLRFTQNTQDFAQDEIRQHILGSDFA